MKLRTASRLTPILTPRICLHNHYSAAGVYGSTSSSNSRMTLATQGVDAAATGSSRTSDGSTTASSDKNLQGASFYPYNYIVKSWVNWLDNNGIPKSHTKQLTSLESLVSGSTVLKDDPVWGKTHIFYNCKDAKSGVSDLYFIDSDFSLSLLETLKADHGTWLSTRGLAPHRSKALAFSTFSSVQQISFKNKAAFIAYRSKQKGGSKVQLLQANKVQYAKFQDEKRGSVMAIDIESYDREHSRVLEIGWCFICFGEDTGSKKLQETRESHHVIISENKYCRNTFVPDNRHHFNFGESRPLPLANAVSQLSDTIAQLQEQGPVILVFHNASAERSYFKQLGLDTSQWQDGFPAATMKALLAPNGPDKAVAAADQLSNEGVYTIDTQHLFGATELEQARPQASLKNTLEALSIPHRYLHNAGNDACYTLAVYEALVGPGVMREDLVEEQKFYHDQQKAALKGQGGRGKHNPKKGGWD